MINNYFEREQYQSSHKVYTHSQYQHSIYLGDIQSALDPEFIRRQHIHTVVTAATGLDHVSFEPPINHIIYPLLDMKSQNISKFFTQFYELVERQMSKGNLLVHCAAGISRSSTLVCAYIMKKHNWGFKEAITFIRKSRPSVLPNLGFERQLKEYEVQLKQQQAEAKNNLERRTGSKTSQQRKHNSLPNKNILPEIGFMGRTQLKPKILDLFTQDNQKQSSHKSRRSNSDRVRPELQFYGTRRATFKPIKSKNYGEKATLFLNTAPQQTPNIRLKQSMPVERVEEVLVRRLHLNDKKIATQRQLRTKPLHKMAFY